MHLYLDASALVKLIAPERHSRELDQAARGRSVVSAEIAITELTRATNRVSREAPASAATLQRRLSSLLESITFLRVDRSIFELAGRLDAPHLRTLDAIHLACALIAGDDVETFVTYDRQQAQAARVAGFEVLAPGLG